MNILAIDPGSNKCGLAFFNESGLYYTHTILTKEKDPMKRRYDILTTLGKYITVSEKTVSEAPVLMGMNNNGMQRFLGVIEFLSKAGADFIHPMTVKKAMGSGTLDKLEVALAAGEKLKTEKEKELMASIIEREAWDESDAVAIGLTYLEKNK